MKRIVSAAFIWFTICATLPAAAAQPLSDAAIAARGKVATGLVEITEAGEFGSAFCIDSAKGTLITNRHVVSHSAGSIKVIFSPGESTQKICTAKVLTMDEELDLALLKIDGINPFSAIELGADDALAELDELIAFGFPFGKELAFNSNDYPSVSINKGHVSSLRKINGRLNRIQLDAVLNPGNSGGPIVDNAGRVVGVAVSGIKGAGGVNFAVPVSHVRNFLSRMIVTLTPPVVTKENRHETAEFKAAFITPPATLEKLDVALVLSIPGTPDRKFSMLPVNGVYVASAVPFPESAKSGALSVSVQSAGNTVTGLVPDCTFCIGEYFVNLNEIVSVRCGAKGEVQMKNGGNLKGPVTRLDALAVDVNGKKSVIKLTDSSEIRLLTSIESTSLVCTLTVTQDKKVIAHDEAIIDLDGSKGAAKMRIASEAPARPRTRAAPPAKAGPSVVGPLPGGTGAASLEAILEGNFNKPLHSNSEVTSLEVVSTAGDYIGHGKRYEYAAGDMKVAAAGGLVTVHIDTPQGGWTLEIAPPKGTLLKPGEYNDAERYPFNEQKPGINFSGEGRGGNELFGKFVVWELSMKGAEIRNLAIDFIQHCEKDGPPLAGSLRYHSNYK